MSKFVWEEGDVVLTPAPVPTEEEANTALVNEEYAALDAALEQVTELLEAAGDEDPIDGGEEEDDGIQ